MQCSLKPQTIRALLCLHFLKFCHSCGLALPCLHILLLLRELNFFVDEDVYPQVGVVSLLLEVLLHRCTLQNLAVIRTRAEPLGINIIVGKPQVAPGWFPTWALL